MLLLGTTRLHGRTGMDTMLAFLCNTFVIYAVFRLLRYRNLRELILVIVAAYLAYLARPDSGLYAALFPALAIWLLGDRDWRRKALAIFCAGIVAVLAVDAVIKYKLFGDIVPLAFHAKRHGYYAEYAGIRLFNPFIYLRNFIISATPLLAVTAIFASRKTVRGLAALFIPVILTIIYFFTIVHIMGHCERYYFPSFPFFIAGAAFAVNSYLKNSRGTSDIAFKRIVISGITIWAILQFLIIGAGIGSRVSMDILFPKTWPFRHRPSRFGPRIHPVNKPLFRTDAGSGLPLLSYWIPFTEMTAILSKLPDDTVVALSEYGYIGAMSPEKRLIDIVGLHDREFAHNGFSAEALFDRRPDIIWLPPMDYTVLYVDIISHDRFWEEYEFYPETYNLGLAVRSQSPHYNLIMEVLQYHWERSYPGYPMELHRAWRV
jgi:hypothetical protein